PGRGLSALAKKLAGLRRQAGVRLATAPAAMDTPPEPTDPAAPARGLPAPAAATPAPGSREATIAQLRTLLKIRAPALAAAPRSIDRALPGVEMSPGLRYHEEWVPWSAGEDVLPLEGIGQEPVGREHVLAFDTETTG